MQILTFCGSLRARSSNRALLRAFACLAALGNVFVHYERLGDLPHFNPDLDRGTVPPEIGTLRSLVARADALAISTPEYAHGLPGSLKNALDWLVSDPAFGGKPVVILHVSRGSTWALDSLKEVLTTMSARIIGTISLPLTSGSNGVDENEILAAPDLRKLLQDGIGDLEQAASKLRAERTLVHTESSARSPATNRSCTCNQRIDTGNSKS